MEAWTGRRSRRIGNPGADSLENITPLAWEKITEVLTPLLGDPNPKANPKMVKTYMGLKTLHQKFNNFFLIRYAPGEVILAKGVYSDFAAIHLSGEIEVVDPGDEVQAVALPASDCWRRPGRIRRWIERRLIPKLEKAGTPPKPAEPEKKPKPKEGEPEPPPPPPPPGPSLKQRLSMSAAKTLRRFFKPSLGDKALSEPWAAKQRETGVLLGQRLAKDANGQLLPVGDRFVGVTGAVWNQKRSVSLIASPVAAEPCEMLLIKRKALMDIIAAAPEFYQKKLDEFIDQTLPELLAENRLFREALYLEDVPEQKWPRQLALLQGRTPAGMTPPIQRLRDVLGPALCQQIDAMNVEDIKPSAGMQLAFDPDRIPQWFSNRLMIIRELDGLLEKDIYDENAWPRQSLGEVVNALIDIPVAKRTRAQKRRLTRILLEITFQGAMNLASMPVLDEETRPFPRTPEAFRELARFMRQDAQGKPLQLVRVDKNDAAFREGEVADAMYLILTGTARVTKQFPGGTMILNHLDKGSYFGEACIEEGAKRSAAIDGLTKLNLLKLDREIVLRMMEVYPSIAQRLDRERNRVRRRDLETRTGRIVPSDDPPPDVRSKLLVTTNLLVIDMDLCTRCDQCVRSCAEAHDDRPRFHRANPKLRFGKWEIAASCLHCSDAPCLEACPVGAITFLETGAVQILRDRCIDCKSCVPECPFDVIDMYPPVGPHDTAKPDIWDEITVATKCDLCLTDKRDPPCVVGCPYDAAHRVPPQQFFERLDRAALAQQ
jgi:Fe-S-cluster-containing hydrogenase component 2/CRP-like cAMP-binding protein